LGYLKLPKNVLIVKSSNIHFTQPMKAVSYTEHGAPDVLIFGEIPLPELSENDVLVKVAATSFNPIEATVRSGAMKNSLHLSFPYVPGLDMAGVVEKAGSAVTSFKKGDRVYAYVNMMRNGASAEYIAVDAADLALAPETISLQEAATLPVAISTSYQGLIEFGNLQPGQRVLITAAAGGMGSFAVQLAKWKGAYVIGTASSKNIDTLKKLGVDQVIDYKNETLETALSEPVDLVLNLLRSSPADATSQMRVLKEGGTFVSATAIVDEQTAAEKNIKVVRMAARRDAATLSKMAKLIDTGVIKPNISERFPLAALATVHANFEAGKNSGKISIVVDENL
jgi:NADPH:quinone reductase-like Zn-dependent oxidoreductase